MKPILFNTAMVRAILDGRKTVTRRVVKPRYRDDESGFQVITRMNGEFVRVEKVDENECGIFADGTERYVNPPYSPGDILYVRETWAVEDSYGDSGVFGFNCVYKADEKIVPCITRDWKRYCELGKFFDKSGWQPSLFMPREAARIFLRVTGVRVERLQDITEEQAIAEGVKAYGQNNCSGTSARIAFAELWDSTLPPNKNRFKCSENEWRTNPWVWVIEFERISKEDAYNA